MKLVKEKVEDGKGSLKNQGRSEKVSTYKKPQLIVLGDVSVLTKLGGSIRTSDFFGRRV